MNASGLAVFEALRPPAGYVTRAALGTTYSIDLLVGTTALCALDGLSVDSTRLGRVQALRALERLRTRTRIAFQQGRLTVPGKANPVFALLDRVVRPVGFANRERSFHPKVWVVRQEKLDGDDDTSLVRYVLVIGSRNLTLDTSWDFGASLVGQVGSETGQVLPRVSTFVAHVCGLIAEPGFAELFPDLDDVCWQLPKGVKKAEFDFHPGGRSRTDAVETLPRCGLLSLPAHGQVLLLSPFLDAEMVQRASRHWRDASQVRLVAGGEDLDKLATQARVHAALAQLCPRVMGVTDPDAASGHGVDLDARPDSQLADLDSEDTEIDPERGLHAKIAAVSRGRSSTMILGSSNLSVRGWGDRNCEAFVRLSGNERLVEPLWEFVERHSLDYTMPEVSGEPSAPDPRKHLEAARDELATCPFVLDETDADRPMLCAEIPWAQVDREIEIHVARMSSGDSWVAWTRGRARAFLARRRADSDRTEFVQIRLRSGDLSLAWMQHVQVEPPLDESRDRQALVRILGLAGFMALLRSLLDEPGASGVGASGLDDARKGRAGAARVARLYQDFSLEALLRRLSRNPDVLDEVQGTVARHRRELSASAHLSDEERGVIDQLWQTLKTIEEGMQR